MFDKRAQWSKKLPSEVPFFKILTVIITILEFFTFLSEVEGSFWAIYFPSFIRFSRLVLYILKQLGGSFLRAVRN